MYTLCVILIVLASILMCLIVLIQNSKGGGLASGFASSNQIMGVRKTTDFLEKSTWGLAAFMVVFSVLASRSLPETIVVEESLLQQDAIENTLVNPALAPDFSQEAPNTESAQPAEAPAAE